VPSPKPYEARVGRHRPKAATSRTRGRYACSGHFSQHPFPDIERWRQVADPNERLREGLSESYAWYEENRQMIAMARLAESA
jgi:hypothetical protein